MNNNTGSKYLILFLLLCGLSIALYNKVRDDNIVGNGFQKDINVMTEPMRAVVSKFAAMKNAVTKTSGASTPQTNQFIRKLLPKKSEAQIAPAGETKAYNAINTCSNGILDDNEADVDCGGDCFQLCETGMRCKQDFDCGSWKCHTINNICIEDKDTMRFLSSSGASGGASGGASPATTTTPTATPTATPTTTPAQTIKCLQVTTPAPIPPPKCECEEKIIDLTEPSKGMISPGYENTFISVIILSCLGAFAMGTCVAFLILQNYEPDASSKVHPGNGLLRKRSITTSKGERLIIEGGDDDQPKNSISAIERAHADGLENLKQDTAQKKKEMADRVAARLLSRKNKMAMKLAKSEALKEIECFKSLQAQHMAMVIGKMRLVTYDEGSVLCEQGDDANEFFVCMDGALRIEVDSQFIRTMGECEFLGEKALLGKNATRGATVTASSKAEVFVLSRHQFELLENDGLPIKEIVSNIKSKVEQYKKDDQALQDVKLNQLRAMQITDKATHISRQSSSIGWADEQTLASQNKKDGSGNNDNEDEEMVILDDEED